MLIFKSFSRLSLLTFTSLASSFFVANLSAQAATFSFSEPILIIDNFSISPQNPSVDSNSKTITFSKDELDFVEANAEVDTIFQADSDSAFFNANLLSDAFGEGNSFSGFGESSSFATGDFAIEANQILSFDFLTTLSIFNEVDNSLDASASSFSTVNFSVIDQNKNLVLGDFTAINSVNTNLDGGINQDLLLVDSNNVSYSGNKYEEFGLNMELAELFLQGSFAHSFNEAARVRLEIGALSRSCVRAPITDDPCAKVPESDNIFALMFGFLGLGLFSQFAKQK